MIAFGRYMSQNYLPTQHILNKMNEHLQYGKNRSNRNSNRIKTEIYDLATDKIKYNWISICLPSTDNDASKNWESAHDHKFSGLIEKNDLRAGYLT